MQFLSIWCGAYIIGSLFHYLLASQKDILRESQTKKMEDLHRFMDERRLPAATRKKLVEYFDFQYKKSVQARASGVRNSPCIPWKRAYYYCRTRPTKTYTRETSYQCFICRALLTVLYTELHR